LIVALSNRSHSDSGAAFRNLANRMGAMTQFCNRLFIQYAPSSLDKQLFISDLISDDASWNLSIENGRLQIGEIHNWRIQVLGTEAFSDQSWLWANTVSNIPDHLLFASLALRAYGEQQGIPELTTPQIPLDQVNGNTLALLASGICEANAYYRCSYESGALFVLILDDNFPKCTDPPLQRVVTVFPQAIALLEIPDHKLALTGYLDHYSLSYEQDGDKIVVKENGEAALTAIFDEQNRLTNLEAKLKPSGTAPKGESWDGFLLRKMMGW
jgi:hypothetical protein